MKHFLTLGAGCALLGIGSLPAQAQFDMSKVTMGIRAGAFFPFDDSMRDLSDIWFTLGIEGEFSAALIPNATTVVSVDWMSYNSGARDNVFPIIVSQRWYTGELGRRTYFQVGIGAAVTDFGPADFLFAARGGVGMEFTEQYFVEANLFWTEKDKADNRVFGVAGYVGIRF